MWVHTWVCALCLLQQHNLNALPKYGVEEIKGKVRMNCWSCVGCNTYPGMCLELENKQSTALFFGLELSVTVLVAHFTLFLKMLLRKLSNKCVRNVSICTDRFKCLKMNIQLILPIYQRLPRILEMWLLYRIMQLILHWTTDSPVALY